MFFLGVDGVTCLSCSHAEVCQSGFGCLSDNRKLELSLFVSLMTRTAQVTWASRPTWWLSASKAAAPAGWRLWLGTLLHSDLSSGRTVNVTGEHRGIPPLWVSESRASVTVYSSYLHEQHQQQCREQGRSPVQPDRWVSMRAAVC